MSKPEEPITASPVDPQFYTSVITQFSWWTDRAAERLFVIAYIRYDDHPTDAGKYVPSTVGMLELKKSNPADRPWQQIVNLYVAGELVKVTP